MKQILLFGAGKSATALISFLVKQTASRGWGLVVADNNIAVAAAKIADAEAGIELNADGLGLRARAVAVDVSNESALEELVRSADVVISLLPPSLHYLVALSCLKCGKHLLTASYLDANMRGLRSSIEAAGLLFLCEMGLDPGIDHMSAMELIHRISASGGRIHSFRSHTGGLVSPSSDDNPWHYKISWNPRNVVMAGSAGAVYLEHSFDIARQYSRVFEDCASVDVPGLGKLAWYPNRDSLSYIPVYGLEGIDTFIRTTLRYPSFVVAWKAIVAAGLTDDVTPLTALMASTAAGLRFRDWSAGIGPFVTAENREALTFLGLFDDVLVPATARNSADVLQYLLETRLAMKTGDKDMIVMLHEIGYHHATGGYTKIQSSLIVEGDDHLQTAMAKTVGLPLGIAAILLLEGQIALRGLHIPILPEIYVPVLRALEDEGIRFTETIVG